MYTSRITPTAGTRFPVPGQVLQPAVHVRVEDLSERLALETALSGAGFRVQSAAAGGFSTPPAGAACLVVDGTMLPMLTPGERAMPTICLVTEGDVATTVQAMRAGAIDVLVRPAAARQLVEAVRNALDVSAASLHQAVEQRRLEKRYADLSQRERQVMGLVAVGLMNKQIAYELRISEITVKAHRGRMMRKMDARSLAGLVQMANRLGLTSPGGRA
jgi:FixJ family two-component response regulator